MVNLQVDTLVVSIWGLDRLVTVRTGTDDYLGKKTDCMSVFFCGIICYTFFVFI